MNIFARVVREIFTSVSCAFVTRSSETIFVKFLSSRICLISLSTASRVKLFTAIRRLEQTRCVKCLKCITVKVGTFERRDYETLITRYSVITNIYVSVNNAREISSKLIFSRILHVYVIKTRFNLISTHCFFFFLYYFRRFSLYAYNHSLHSI